MAERRAPHTDREAIQKEANNDDQPYSLGLTDYQLNSAIRGILIQGRDKFGPLKARIEEDMQSSKFRSDSKHAVSGKPPKGSDQIDVGSLCTWASRVIRSGDKRAKKQLQVIAATLGCENPKG
jgi:hypothetical protein